MKSKRMLALVVGASFIFSSVACKKGGKAEDSGKTAALEAVRSAPASGQIIQESDPFFDLEEFELTLPVEEGRVLCARWCDQLKVFSNCILVTFEDTYGMDPELQDKWKKHVTGQKLLGKEEAEKIEKLYYDKFVDTLAVYNLDGTLKDTIRCGTDFNLECFYEGKNGEIMLLYNQGGTAKISELSSSMELTNTKTLLEELQYVSQCELMPDGNILVMAGGKFAAFDPEGNTVFNRTDTSCQGIFMQDGKYYQLISNLTDSDSFFRFVDFDLSTGMMLADKHDAPIAYGDEEKLICGSGTPYLNTGNALCRVNITSGDLETVIPWNQTDCYHGEIIDDSLKVVSNDEYYFAISTYHEEDQAADAEGDQTVYRVTLQHLRKAAKNPHAGKRVLSAMGSNSDNEVLYDCIVDYNRDMTKKNRVVLTEYSESWLMAFTKRSGASGAQIDDQIYMDILNGQGPDILINFGAQLKYERDTVLLDLNTLIDGPQGLDRSTVFDNVLRASEKNGKLYRIPLMYQITGFAGKTEYVGERTSCTWEELNAVSASVPEQAILLLPELRKQILFELLGTSLERFVNFDTQEVNFNNEEFRNILEFAKKNGCSVEELQNLYTTQSYLFMAVQQDMVAMRVPYISDGTGFSSLRGKGPVSFFGFPSSGEGRMAVVDSFTISISKSSAYPAEAWDFIKSLLEEGPQTRIPGDYSKGLPLNREAMNRRNEISIKEEELSRSLGVTGATTFDENEAKEFLDLIGLVNTGWHTDVDILTIISEEAEGFFAGQKSVDDVIKTIEKRTRLVVQERA